MYKVNPRGIIMKLMAKAGLNPTTLGAKAGVPQPTVWRFFKGKHKTVELETIRKFADALNVTVSQALGETPLAEDEVLSRGTRLLAQMPRDQRVKAVKIIATMAEPAGGDGDESSPRNEVEKPKATKR